MSALHQRYGGNPLLTGLQHDHCRYLFGCWALGMLWEMPLAIHRFADS